MSLLMDALRKAEADKKQADSTGKRDAVVLDSSAEEPRQIADAISADRTHDSDPSINVKFADLTAAGQPAADELTLEPLVAAVGADDPVPDPVRAAASGSVTIQSMRGDEIERESSLSASSAAREPATEELRSGVEADRSARADSRDAGITETVASAHTVFEAGSGGASRRMIVWGILIVSLIGCLLLAGGFFYFEQLPKTHTLPSPSVALGVETSPPKSLLPVPRPAITANVAESATQVEPVIADPIPIEAPLTVVATGPIDVEERSVHANAPPAEEDTRHEAQDSVVGSNIERPGPSEPPVLEDNVPAPQFGVALGEVRIARSQTARDIEPLLNDAYTAYIAGDYAGAKRLYEAVLKVRPERRDALLGLAALTLREGDEAGAHALYRQVLRRDPDNATAVAALLSIEGGGGDEITESRLKLMLDEGVDVGYIYFSLGNLYARNNRWADAQQAYFEALRNYPKNPDYNYNLAVSLDRIGQRAAAVKYYEAAVNLADAGPAGFDPASALARLRAISGSGVE